MDHYISSLKRTSDSLGTRRHVYTLSNCEECGRLYLRHDFLLELDTMWPYHS